MSASAPRQSLASAVVVAAALAAALTREWQGIWLVAGIAALGIATVRWETGSLGVAAALSVVGGWLVTRFALADSFAGWRGVVGVLVAVAVAAGIGRAEQVGLPDRVVLVAIAVTALAVFLCVPETDGVGRVGIVLGVAALVAAVTSTPVAREILGAGAAVLWFSALDGGQYRASAVVGAAASFGVLATAWVLPALRRLPGWRPRVTIVRDALLVGIHGLAAVVASRIAGRGPGLTRAVVVAFGASVLLVVGVAVLTHNERERT